MRENPAFQYTPQSQIILRDFDAPVNVAEKYIQRLTGYLQAPESGNYTFYVACDDLCELWMHDVTEKGIETVDKKSEKTVSKQPIITVERWTDHQQWDKYKAQQTSQPIFLNKCRIYQMEVFMSEIVGPDHVSLGMRRPNGEYERPIPRKRLFWTKPGTRKLEVTLENHESSMFGFVGAALRISGFFQFCCDSLYCPDCLLQLKITTLGQNITINPAVSLSCVKTSFTAVFDAIKQPGNFTVKISSSFASNLESTVHQRVLGHLHLQAVVLKECYFQSEYCGWTQPDDMPKKWKLTDAKPFVNYPGSFAFVDGPYKAQLDSPLLPWQPFHKSVGLCLRFNYLMPAKSKPTLKVYLRDTSEENLVLIWNLTGNHGEKWSAAQVAWPGAGGTQIIFKGEGVLEDEINVAFDDVIITTENCLLRPYFAQPGFKCSEDRFTCKNGECVKKNLLCDGDFACKDHSDEENCECPSSMFACKGGGCLLATAVCDGYEDCSSGDDESSCRNPCPSSHQCLDGSCIPWSDTCSQTPFCKDGTNTPSICGSTRCNLNDLACTSKNSTGQKRCRSFRGNCNFQTGHCGLKPDKNATFQWTVGTGQTQTERTGPSYDHTSFSKDGFYIYIEASRRNFGDETRLLSDWMKPNETVCVKFWYHMHGSDIGNLSIYLKTNQSETLVWMVSGDQGNRWRYGQTALNSTLWFKFVLEGAVGTGSKGDIAVDDFTVVDGACEKIFKQTSPDCYFEESGCDWYVHDGGVLNTHLAGMGKRGYASLPVGASELPCFLSSPIINSIAYEWKCLRFWHKASLTVLLNNTNTNKTQHHFHAEEATNMWRYAQLPIPVNSTQIQIHFVGVCKFTHGPFLAIANVSFTKEPCKLIPWSAVKDCQKPLGMENGIISKKQITTSSQWDANHAPSQGRLHFKQSGVKQGSWSTSVNDDNQWLQVALGIRYMKVTAVATQGRNAVHQWVTKYKLQYSGDGISFQYYKKPGNIEEEVI